MKCSNVLARHPVKDYKIILTEPYFPLSADKTFENDLETITDLCELSVSAILDESTDKQSQILHESSQNIVKCTPETVKCPGKYSDLQKINDSDCGSKSIIMEIQALETLNELREKIKKLTHQLETNFENYYKQNGENIELIDQIVLLQQKINEKKRKLKPSSVNCNCIII